MSKVITPEIMLDTRKAKKNGLYPIKLRIIFSRKAKYYSTNHALSKDDFEAIKSCKKPPNKLATVYSEVYGQLAKAIDVIQSLKSFSFAQFENRYLGVTFKGDSVTQLFEAYISVLSNEGRAGNSDAYRLALKSLKKFHKEHFKKDDILLTEITIDWLNTYEAYMIKWQRSYATIGIYLRSLRCIFNKAVKDNQVLADYYPFGKGKYVIPATQRRKKALSTQELSKLLNCQSINEYEEKARDYWFFSFYSNGMNIFDIAQLTWNSVDGDNLYFIRRKTKHTTKGNQTEIVVHLNPFIKKMIAKYSQRGQKNDYIFPILRQNMTEQEKKVTVKTFTRFVNQHIKNLARRVGANPGISTVWARHTFTTSVIRMGGSMEFVQESLGHQNMQTTMNYWAGFDHDYRKTISNKLVELTQGKL